MSDSNIKVVSRSIGALIYFFELLVACLASRLEINAYNQPGVEDVKKIVLGTLGDLRYSDQALKSSL
jgi:glucose-6-phosphate isomerase